MLFHQQAPRPPLDAFIESIWLYHGDPRPHAPERVLPTGAAQLIVNLKEDRTRSCHPDHREPCETAAATPSSTRSGMGVAFQPGGTLPFLRVPAHELSEAVVGLDAMWGRGPVSTLCDRLLSAPGVDAKLDAMEGALAAMWKDPSCHPGVAFALDVFGRRPEAAPIGPVAGAAGLSRKRFIPKRY